MCIIDGNVARGLTFMLSFTVTHRYNVNAKIYAPNRAAPQTDAYLEEAFIYYANCRGRKLLQTAVISKVVNGCA